MSFRRSGLAAFVGEARTLLALGLPSIATQVLMTSMGVVDTLMLGRVGTEAVAAAGLGHIWVVATQLVALGMVLGVDPLMSQALGRRDPARATLLLQRGIALALLLSVAVGALWLFTGPILLAFGQDPGLARAAHGYALAQIPGIPGFLVFAVLRQYLQARGIVVPATCVMLLANGLNAFGNWVLIYGNLGCPALGVVGAGLSTAISRIAQALLLLAALRWITAEDGHRIRWSRASFAPAGLRPIAALGFPIGLQFGLEIWAFALAALFAGWLGTAELAANAITLNLASLSFTMPLGLSFASSARVGNLIGAADVRGAQLAARTALCLSAVLMGLAGLVFAVFRTSIPRLYTEAPEVVAVCAATLPIAAAFQVFDGLQVVGGAVLRGMGRTRSTAVIHLTAFYGLGIPAAWFLAFRAGLGLPGIWTGLALGLFAAATMLIGWIETRGRASGRGRRVLRERD